MSETEDEFPSITHLYYAISRSLRWGSNADKWPRRPPLPMEVILHIFELAGLMKEAPTKSLTRHINEPCTVYSSGPMKKQTLIVLAVTKSLLRSQQIQLVTCSQDERGFPFLTGSWFELDIYCPTDEITPQEQKVDNCGTCSLALPRVISCHIDADTHQLSPTYVPKSYTFDPTKRLEFTSHVHEFYAFDYLHEGELFGPEHEIWTHLNEGDIIQVEACSRFGWKNIVEGGWLRIWERFDPTGLG